MKTTQICISTAHQDRRDEMVVVMFECLFYDCPCLHQCARALGMCCYVSTAEEGEVRFSCSNAIIFL